MSASLRFKTKLSATPSPTDDVPPYRTSNVLKRLAKPPASAIGALVVTLIWLVHGLGEPPSLAAEPSLADRKTARTTTAPALKRSPMADLPIPVQEMRDAILIAVASGDIEELRTPIEWNELRPEFGIPRDKDPITHWRNSSKDGAGHEILAILGNLLASDPARLPIGPDLENNDVFVWPYISELPPDKLTPSQEVELFRMMPPAEAAKIRKGEKWTWYRLAIAADGTWHIFSKPSVNP